jgi:hypothetical protein
LLVAGLFWEKSTVGWWLISQANRASVSHSTITIKVWSTVHYEHPLSHFVPHMFLPRRTVQTTF